jgi:VanZ family protein
MTTNRAPEISRKTAAQWSLVAAWTAFILWAGSDAYSADNTSRFLGPLVRWLLPDASPQTQEAWLFGLRKAAHVVEYGILAAVTWLALHGGRRAAPWRNAALALAWVLAIASLDEVRQGFIDSRTGSAGDVALDVAGGILALALAIAYTRCMQREPGPVAHG